MPVGHHGGMTSLLGVCVHPLVDKSLNYNNCRMLEKERIRPQIFFLLLVFSIVGQSQVSSQEAEMSKKELPQSMVRRLQGGRDGRRWRSSSGLSRELLVDIIISTWLLQS